MKLSINQSVVQNNGYREFVISAEHCKRISVFVWDWYSSLPREVKECVEVIVVTPEKTHGGDFAINLKVVISGVGGWKSEFGVCLTHSYWRDRNAGKMFKNKEKAEDLSRELMTAIESEMNTRGTVLANLGSLLLLMKQQEA